MGDITDWMHESGMLDMPDPFYDDAEYEWGGAQPPQRRRGHVLRCRNCGAIGLNWQMVKGSKWRLHEGRLPHVCKTSADGFEDEPT